MLKWFFSLRYDTRISLWLPQSFCLSFSLILSCLQLSTTFPLCISSFHYLTPSISLYLCSSLIISFLFSLPAILSLSLAVSSLTLFFSYFLPPFIAPHLSVSNSLFLHYLSYNGEQSWNVALGYLILDIAIFHGGCRSCYYLIYNLILYSISVFLTFTAKYRHVTAAPSALCFIRIALCFSNSVSPISNLLLRLWAIDSFSWENKTDEKAEMLAWEI